MSAAAQCRTGVVEHALRVSRRSPSPAEQARLARRVKLGDLKAKQEMTERNLGLVYAIARPYRSRSAPFADLVQEGTVGLMRAVERFDPDRGVKFSTYAVPWIRRSVLDAIGAAPTIRIPAQAAQQLAAVRQVEHDLERAGVRAAPTQVVAERCGLSQTSVRVLRGAARVAASLDETVGDSSISLAETIGDPRIAEPEQQIAERERQRYAWELLKMLPPRHRQVLIRRYGIGGGRPRSHREIGQTFGVKEERSRQLEREALHRLRELPTLKRHIIETLTP
jgi:RNA polymerase primary sigma factor